MYYVEYLRKSKNGINVYLRDRQGEAFIISNVHPNVVRCAIGESDMQYLLNTRNHESFCRLTENEIQDFIKHRVV